MLKKLLTSGAVLAIVSTGAVNSAQAQVRGDKAIYFTFDQPVTVPQKTLPAGKYLFRLADSLANRQIVQIYSADGADNGKLAAMMMTLPVSRNDLPNDAEIRFLETAAATPPAIATYWYPGQKEGWEFIYPRSQATTIAKAAKQPVLTTAADVSDDEMKTANLVRVDASGQQEAANVNAGAAVSTSGRTARGEFAAETATEAPRATATGQSSQTPAAPAPRVSTAATQPAQSDVSNPAPARVRSSSAMTGDTRTELPATASSMPTVALIGVIALAGALWLTRRAHA